MPSAGTTAPPRVLVVEDDAVLRLAMTRLLRREGYDVREAADGAEGIAVARRTRPDLIILDVMMPNVDGLGMLYVVRHDDDLGGIPVVIHSALRDRATMDMAASLGARAFVVKGDDVDGLLREVRELLLGTTARP